MQPHTEGSMRARYVRACVTLLAAAERSKSRRVFLLFGLSIVRKIRAHFPGVRRTACWERIAHWRGGVSCSWCQRNVYVSHVGPRFSSERNSAARQQCTSRALIAGCVVSRESREYTLYILYITQYCASISIERRQTRVISTHVVTLMLDALESR